LPVTDNNRGNTLKIDNSIKSTASPGAKETKTRPAAAASPAPAAQAPKPGPRDEVKITSLSSQLQALESSLNNTAVVDTARVEAIKQAISDGHFKVHSDVVADRLLNTVKELLAKQKV
jgi:negative regulator of flagellin synthesis FlgM